MIEINNLTSAVVDEKFLKKIAKIVLAGEQKISKYPDSQISIALVGQKRIKELNKKYRGKNRATDVLAFSYGDSGEIVICPKEAGKELAKVLIHGILHILGYSHEQMEDKQNYYLSLVTCVLIN